MKRGLVFVVACSSAPTRPPEPPAPLPAATTICYAGVSTGMGQRSRTIARRIVDPAARQITEDVSHDDAGAHGAKSFHVVMDVDGDHFTMKETGGAFTGTGTLSGEPWQWTAWSSVSQIAGGIEVESDDELTPTGMKATKQIHQGGKVLATTEDALKTFDCAQWDAVKATLAVPALDDAACDHACRNYATLKFWQGVGDVSDELHQQKATELETKLSQGLATCVEQCLSANDAIVTACLVAAKSVDDLGACDH